MTLSMQRTEQTSGPQPVAAGVPGTASNAPNSQALPVYPQQTTPPQTAKTESGTYGASKTVRHVIEKPGQVRRLTAAIVVNDRLAQPATGRKAAVWQPRSAEELRNLTALAQAAVGFDAARGDMLTVEDLAFDENRSEPAAPRASECWSTRRRDSPVLVKYAALLAGLLVVLAFGVRPPCAMPVRACGQALAKAGTKEIGAGASRRCSTPPSSLPSRPRSIRSESGRRRSSSR